MVEPGRLGGALGGPGFDLVEKARDAIARHGMLHGGGEPLVVGVSGGQDSICLLDVLARLRAKLGLEIAVAHVDHGLSDASSVVAARVGKVASEAGFDVHVARAPDLTGPNLQARARDFRYEFFDIVAGRVGADRVATAHTLDDRVETLLARLVHGAQTEVLAGFGPVDGRRIRPLIETRRAETRRYCEERGLEFFDDPANEDARFDRTKVRAELLPMIERLWGEGATRSMARTAALLKEDAALLHELADNVYQQVVKATDDAIELETDVLRSMPRPIRRRLLQHAVGRVRDRSGGIEAALDALDREVQAESRFAVASGTEIVVGPERVTVSRMTS